ncbi:hypothetical protein [Gemmatimonas sp.]|uniref:hypothetical protein n=1 Tax=Gemmatimonas sp. TaxID=1962908 RepID=UPI003F6E4A18
MCFSVDGPLLERWFLKTAINATVLLERAAIWAVDETTARPPMALVEMAYGLRPVERPFGLYAAARVGDGFQSQDRVSCHPLSDTAGRIAAALFEFRGFSFLLNMRAQEPDFILTNERGGGILRTGNELFFRLSRINNDVGGFRSHYLDFSWPSKDFYHFAA